MHKMSLPKVKAYTSICNKEIRARIENLRPSELLVAKTALIMLKFTPITLQIKRKEGGHQRKTRNVGATPKQGIRVVVQRAPT